MSSRNYSFYRNGNLCKGTSVSKIISGAKLHACAGAINLVHWFFLYVGHLKFAAFWCFTAGQGVKGCVFSNIDVLFFIGLHRLLEHI